MVSWSHTRTGSCRLGELVLALVMIKGQGSSPDLNGFWHTSLKPSAVLVQDLNFCVESMLVFIKILTYGWWLSLVFIESLFKWPLSFSDVYGVTLLTWQLVNNPASVLTGFFVLMVDECALEGVDGPWVCRHSCCSNVLAEGFRDTLNISDGDTTFIFLTRHSAWMQYLLLTTWNVPGLLVIVWYTQHFLQMLSLLFFVHFLCHQSLDSMGQCSKGWWLVNWR